MKMNVFIICVFLCLSLLSNAIAQELDNVTTEQDTISEDSLSIAPGNALLQLLSGSTGWSGNLPADDVEEAVYPSSRTSIFAANLEFIKLIESLVRLKGDIFGRVNDIIVNNYDIISAAIRLLIGKIRTLHNFSLVGLSVLIRILEYASDTFSQIGNSPNFS